MLECGKTIDELSDYLAAERNPPNVDIDTCPGCLSTLAGMDHVAQLSRDLVAHDAVRLPDPPELWLTTILSNIASEVRTGRSLPLHHDDDRVSLSITEGAVRALVRAVGDDIDGIIIGACRIDGDAETLGAPVDVTVSASILWGRSAQEAGDTLRRRIRDALRTHTDLSVAAVNVSIDDLHGVTADQKGTT